MTNADRIRNMTDSQLAEFLYEVWCNTTQINYCAEDCENCKFTGYYCIDDILLYLTSEVDESDD